MIMIMIMTMMMIMITLIYYDSKYEPEDAKVVGDPMMSAPVYDLDTVHPANSPASEKVSKSQYCTEESTKVTGPLVMTGPKFRGGSMTDGQIPPGWEMAWEMAWEGGNKGDVTKVMEAVYKSPDGEVYRRGPQGYGREILHQFQYQKFGY